MRWLVILLVTLVTPPAFASPYDVGWATFSFGLGGSPHISGGLAGRIERDPCDQGSCLLSSRLSLGGGLGRWGFELQLGSNPVIDHGATDARDRDRRAFRVGPIARYTLVRRYGFDLSVRAGLHAGSLHGSTSTTSMPDPSCPIDREGMCPPIAMTYEPDTYSLLALPLGTTLRLGVRTSDRGFLAVFADLEYTLVRVGFPDQPRTGALRTLIYGVNFGMMFDVRR